MTLNPTTGNAYDKAYDVEEKTLSPKITKKRAAKIGPKSWFDAIFFSRLAYPNLDTYTLLKLSGNI